LSRVLKIRFLEKNFFSIKKCLLDKSLLDSLEFQSHLLEAWSAAHSVRPGGGRSRPSSPTELLPAEARPGSSKLQVTQWWRRRWWWGPWRWEPVLPTSVFLQHSRFLGGSAWQKQTQRGEERVNHRAPHRVEETERKHGSEGRSLTASPERRGSWLGRHQDRQAGRGAQPALAPWPPPLQEPPRAPGFSRLL